MTFSPHISIYPEGDFNYAWFGSSFTKAIWIFSKNLGYNKKLSRTRLNIHLGNENRIHTESNIKSIWLKNEIDTSVEISEIEKTNQVHKIIHESLKTVGQIEGWDIELIEKALIASISDNGNFTWFSKSKVNKKRTFTARIKMSLLEEKVEIVAAFLDRKSTLQFEIKIIDTFTHHVDWTKAFSKPCWISNEKFGFNLMKSQLLIFVNLETRKSEIIIAPKSETQEEVEGQLRHLTYRQFSDTKEFVEWVSK